MGVGRLIFDFHTAVNVVGVPAADAARASLTCVEINQCVGCANRHRHAIEQASRRWRGDRRDDSGQTRREIVDFRTESHLLVVQDLALARLD